MDTVLSNTCLKFGDSSNSNCNSKVSVTLFTNILLKPHINQFVLYCVSDDTIKTFIMNNETGYLDLFQVYQSQSYINLNISKNCVQKVTMLTMSVPC